jgi:hypothetical protein
LRGTEHDIDGRPLRCQLSVLTNPKHVASVSRRSCAHGASSFAPQMLVFRPAVVGGPRAYDGRKFPRSWTPCGQALRVDDTHMEHLYELAGKEQPARRTAAAGIRADISGALNGFTNAPV